MKNAAKTVSAVTAITIASRVLSLVSVQLYLSVFGADNVRLNIYSFALSVPNIIFTCIGTSLTTVVIPVYAALLAKDERDTAKKFVDNILTCASALIVCLIGIGFVIAPLIPMITSYRDTQYTYAVYALRVLMPIMFFYGLNYIFQGVLQANGRFKMPALVTLPSSLTVILYVVFLSGRFGVDGLLWATFIGLSLQAVILLPSLLATGYRYSFSMDFKNPELLTAAKLTPPVLIGVSAYQINMFVNMALATRFNTVPIMSYAQNIILSSVLTLVYSITAIYYPRLTQLWALNDIQEYRTALNQIIAAVVFLVVPATVGFIMLRFPFFDLVSGWGNFSADNVITAGNILGFYALGIVAVSIKEVLDRAFYAQQNTKISAIIGFVVMAVNISLSFILLDKLGTYSMPFAYSLASIVGATALMLIMRRKLGGLGGDSLIHALKCCLCACIMGAVIYAELRVLPAQPGLASKLLLLFVPVVTGVIVYFISAYAMGISQARMVKQAILSYFRKGLKQ